MKTRSLLLVACLGVALAGCATPPEGTPTADAPDATPPAAMSDAQATALFLAAAQNVPEKYGMDMTATKGGASLMTAHAAFDGAADTAFFQLTMDPSLTGQMGSGGAMGFDASQFQQLSMYTTPQGSAVLLGDDSVLVTGPDNEMMGQAAHGSDGFGALSDPEDFFGDIEESNFTVTRVTPTTLRGQGALQVDATFVEDGEPQDVTVWLFQDPARIARLQVMVPAETSEDSEEMEEPDPFAGATMTMDMLYEDEVTLTPPAGLTRALGLRFESDGNPFFGGGQGPVTWTFQVDGGVPVGDVVAEVGDNATAPDWTMPLSEGTKSVEGVTLTFLDADADGAVSEGDTLVIETADDAGPVTVALRDTQTGLRVVPGAGLLAVLAALAGAILLARRG